VQTTLKMFLRQCTLRLVRSAKFPLGGGTKVFLARGLTGKEVRFTRIQISA
jgi:hypothetical protein